MNLDFFSVRLGVLRTSIVEAHTEVAENAIPTMYIPASPNSFI